MEEIDIVIPWVDGADPAWQAQRACYTADADADAGVARYRDWGTMRAWFRGIDVCVPWVRKIHFVTWGHVPGWLDTEHPRLHVVRHGEFIPEEYLPTFSSHTIELNMHRIEGLADRFIYFNDDVFLLRPLPPSRFFRGGLPCDHARLNVIMPSSVAHVVLNDVEAINRRHARRGALRGRIGKWLNYRYRPGDLCKTLTLLPWNVFPGFRDHHMAQPFLKATFDKMWREEYALLDATCRNRFRALTDVNQWLMRYEQLVCGDFEPIGMRDTRLDLLSDESVERIAAYITQGSYGMICLNDSERIKNFPEACSRLNEAFETLFPNPCGFEKDKGLCER